MNQHSFVNSWIPIGAAVLHGTPSGIVRAALAALAVFFG